VRQLKKKNRANALNMEWKIEKHIMVLEPLSSLFTVHGI
jgi:hypothetical protein